MMGVCACALKSCTGRCGVGVDGGKKECVCVSMYAEGLRDGDPAACVPFPPPSSATVLPCPMADKSRRNRSHGSNASPPLR
jgi:hypothetical protein